MGPIASERTNERTNELRFVYVGGIVYSSIYFLFFILFFYFYFYSCLLPLFFICHGHCRIFSMPFPFCVIACGLILCLLKVRYSYDAAVTTAADIDTIDTEREELSFYIVPMYSPTELLL